MERTLFFFPCKPNEDLMNISIQPFDLGPIENKAKVGGFIHFRGLIPQATGKIARRRSMRVDALRATVN